MPTYGPIPQRYSVRPNIWGTLWAREGSITGGAGSFSVQPAGDTAGLINYVNGGSTRVVSLNASALKNIYGDATTVQVDALKGYMLIRYA